jgi:hypothetical protein
VTMINKRRPRGIRRPVVHPLAASLAAMLLACDGLLPSGDEGPPRIWISDTAFRLAPGESVQLASYFGGSAPRDLAREWSSSSPAVLEVDAAGRLTARSPGRVVVYVRAGRLVDSATVVVAESDVEDRTTWASVSAGDGFTCALDASGHRSCWGHNGFGAHGNGIRRLHTAIHAPAATPDPTSISCGGRAGSSRGQPPVVAVRPVVVTFGPQLYRGGVSEPRESSPRSPLRLSRGGRQARTQAHVLAWLESQERQSTAKDQG